MRRVALTERQQFLVRAPLHYSAAFQEQNLVRGRDRGELMRDHEHGLLPVQGGDSGGDGLLVLRIQRPRSFVE